MASARRGSALSARLPAIQLPSARPAMNAVRTVRTANGVEPNTSTMVRTQTVSSTRLDSPETKKRAATSERSGNGRSLVLAYVELEPLRQLEAPLVAQLGDAGAEVQREAVGQIR